MWTDNYTTGLNQCAEGELYYRVEPVEKENYTTILNQFGMRSILQDLTSVEGKLYFMIEKIWMENYAAGLNQY